MDETGQEEAKVKEESQELIVQQLWVTVHQVTAQQQATVQEGQEKKVSFRINFQKQHKITCTITVTFLSRRLCQRGTAGQQGALRDAGQAARHDQGQALRAGAGDRHNQVGIYPARLV